MTRRLPDWLARPLVVGLVLRLVALLVLAPHVPLLGDATGYLFLARHLRDHGELADLQGGVRPPLYPILIAPALDSDPDDAAAFPGVFLVQIAADLGALALLAGLTRRRFGERAGAAAAWLHALLPTAALYAGTLVMAESCALLVTAASLVALDALDRALDGPPRAWPLRALLLGALLGLGLLVKELGALVAVALLLALLLRRGVGPLRRVGAVMLAAVALLAVTAPWAWRNIERHGVPLITGSFGHLSVILDNAPPGESGWLLLLQRESLRDKVDLSHELLRRELLEYPALTAERALVRLRLLLGPEDMLPCWLATAFDGYQPDARTILTVARDSWRLPLGLGKVVQVVAGLTTIALFGLAAAGMALAGAGTLRRAALLAVLGLLLGTALTVGLARYRLMLEPFALPFAGLALVTALDATERRATSPGRRGDARRTGLLVALLLAVTILVLPAP
ncbi:MAG TPA: glycosyltransferase family 39 protein [Planctomycetota bacterium]|nr:glycosyltransferase family 39 protein [Planctomycetota bacterium]